MRLRVVWRASVVASILLCFGRESTAQKVSGKDTPRPALLDQARTFMAANDLERARAIAEQVIASDPTSGEAHDLLGFVLGKQGHTAEAIAEFERAVQLRPTLFDAQYHLGATRWWTRDLDGALPALTAAVQLRPGHAEARYYLGLTPGRSRPTRASH